MTSTGLLILLGGFLLIIAASVPPVSTRLRLLVYGNPNSADSRGLYFGWYIVTTTMFIAFVTTGARSSFGIFIIPMSEEFGWNRTTISLAAAMGFLINGVTQPFIGHFFDKLGGRKVILIGLVATGLATAALSLTFHFLFLAFMFGIVLSTALSGSSTTNTMALLAKWFRRKQATVLGLNVAGGSLGGLLLVPFGMYLLQATDWRVTWIALGMIVLVLAVPLSFLFIHNDPAQRGLQRDGEQAAPETARAQAAQRGPFEVDKWKESLRSPPMWQISGAFFVCGVTTGIISAHFVPYAIDRGVSPSIAAAIFGFMMGLNVVGGIGAGILADRFGRKNVLGVVYFVRGTAYVLLLLMPGTAGLWIFATFAGFSWIASVPLTTTLTADVYGLRALGAISGVAFLCHQVGSFFSILLGGILYDLSGSYTLPFAIAGAFLFPASLSAFSINEQKYSARYQPAMAAAAQGSS
jgi:MFS family permease